VPRNAAAWRASHINNAANAPPACRHGARNGDDARAPLSDWQHHGGDMVASGRCASTLKREQRGGNDISPSGSAATSRIAVWRCV